MIPSTEVTHFPSMARIAENTAVDTPLVSFKAQLGLAPSQIIPVRQADNPDVVDNYVTIKPRVFIYNPFFTFFIIN